MKVGEMVVLQHINGALILGRVSGLYREPNDEEENAGTDGDAVTLIQLEQPLVFMEDRHPQTGAPIVRIQNWGTSFVEETNEAVMFDMRLIERRLTPKKALENVWLQHTSKLDLTTQLPPEAKSSIITG